MLSGIVMLVSSSQPRKAKLPMLVTPSSTTTVLTSSSVHQAGREDAEYSVMAPLPEIVRTPSLFSAQLSPSPQEPESTRQCQAAR